MKDMLMVVFGLIIVTLTIITAIYISYKVYRTYFYKQVSPLMVIPITFIIIESVFLLGILNIEIPILKMIAGQILIIVNISLIPFIIFDILSILKIQIISDSNKQVIIPSITISIYILAYICPTILTKDIDAIKNMFY